ncbi:MAG: nucleoside triphosphate pyrophosphatase [Solirubrobacterales bacterium]|nr:nucleoside triphosphate pyrophosphatase [Solirubrobacterales bacterium]
MVIPGVEEQSSGADAAAVVLQNARAKARAGLEMTVAGSVLGADTDVVLDGRLLGKAADPPSARERLEALSGRAHQVLTALVLLDRDSGAERSGVERTTVRFRDIDDFLLERYVSSGEWRDRAGGYAVQGLGSALVESVEGDLSNVIGMPVRLFAQLAPEFLPKP